MIYLVLQHRQEHQTLWQEPQLKQQEQPHQQATTSRIWLMESRSELIWLQTVMIRYLVLFFAYLILQQLWKYLIKIVMTFGSITYWDSNPLPQDQKSHTLNLCYQWILILTKLTSKGRFHVNILIVTSIVFRKTVGQIRIFFRLKPSAQGKSSIKISAHSELAVADREASKQKNSLTSYYF